MDHLTDKQLLNMLSQPVRDKTFADHLAGCESCAQRLQSLKDPWDALGQWDVDAPDIDLTNRILSKIQGNAPIFLQQPRALIRVAASIIIGVGAGSWLGQTTARPVSDEQVTEAMYLDELTLNSSTGWTSPLLEEGQE
jgi:hypothetical protein